jgi:hypothetical protein
MVLRREGEGVSEHLVCVCRRLDFFIKDNELKVKIEGDEWKEDKRAPSIYLNRTLFLLIN